MFVEDQFNLAPISAPPILSLYAWSPKSLQLRLKGRCDPIPINCPNFGSNILADETVTGRSIFHYPAAIKRVWLLLTKDVVERGNDFLPVLHNS